MLGNAVAISETCSFVVGTLLRTRSVGLGFKLPATVLPSRHFLVDTERQLKRVHVTVP